MEPHGLDYLLSIIIRKAWITEPLMNIKTDQNNSLWSLTDRKRFLYSDHNDKR